MSTVRPGAVITPIFQKFGASAQAPERAKLHKEAAKIYGHLYNKKPTDPDELIKMSATTEVSFIVAASSQACDAEPVRLAGNSREGVFRTRPLSNLL